MAESSSTSSTGNSQGGTGDGLNAQQRMELRRLDHYSAMVLYAVVGIVVLAAIWGVRHLVLHQSVQIANVDYARGLITVLFSFGVVSMALLIVLNLLLQRRTTQEDPHSQQRFQNVKEILALLLGILGTVVGYYFGTSSGANPIPTIVDVVISDTTPEAGGDVTFSVFVQGGTAPYVYKLAFAGAELDTISDRTSDASFRQVVTLPDELPAANIEVTLEITDAAGIKVSYPEKLSFSIQATSSAPDSGGEPEDEPSDPVLDKASS